MATAQLKAYCINGKSGNERAMKSNNIELIFYNPNKCI